MVDPKDPTANVVALAAADSKRHDDLLAAERRYNDLRAEHQKEVAALRAEFQKAIAELRAAHQMELSAKESSRVDSIRQVDREEVAKAAASANLAITTLAKNTTDLATTLQAQVAATASAAETRRTADMSEVNKRVSALELASSASAGKQQVADPMMAELLIEVKNLRQSRAGDDGGAAAIAAARERGYKFIGIVVAIAIGIAGLILKYGGG